MVLQSNTHHLIGIGTRDGEYLWDARVCEIIDGTLKYDISIEEKRFRSRNWVQNSRYSARILDAYQLIYLTKYNYANFLLHYLSKYLVHDFQSKIILMGAKNVCVNWPVSMCRRHRVDEISNPSTDRRPLFAMHHASYPTIPVSDPVRWIRLAGQHNRYVYLVQSADTFVSTNANKRVRHRCVDAFLRFVL
jgi:hypothetical protein